MGCTGKTKVPLIVHVGLLTTWLTGCGPSSVTYHIHSQPSGAMVKLSKGSEPRTTPTSYDLRYRQLFHVYKPGYVPKKMSTAQSKVRDGQRVVMFDLVARDAPEANDAVSAYLKSSYNAPFQKEAQDMQNAVAFADAARKNTVEAYDNFARRFRKSPQAAEAKQRAEGLVWEQAKQKDRYSDYVSYLKRYPKGTHRDAALAAQKRLSQDGWDRAVATNTIEGYRAFRADYPGSPFEQTSRQRELAIYRSMITKKEAALVTGKVTANPAMPQFNARSQGLQYTLAEKPATYDIPKGYLAVRVRWTVKTPRDMKFHASTGTFERQSLPTAVLYARRMGMPIHKLIGKASVRSIKQIGRDQDLKTHIRWLRTPESLSEKYKGDWSPDTANELQQATSLTLGEGVPFTYEELHVLPERELDRYLVQCAGQLFPLKSLLPKSGQAREDGAGDRDGNGGNDGDGANGGENKP